MNVSVLTKTFLFVGFYFLLYPYSCIAQKQVSGKVTDSLQKPVPFANIVAYHTGKDTLMLAFAQSNPNGEFKLSVHDSTQKLALRVSFLGYREVWKEITLTTSKYTLPEPVILLSTAVQFNDVFVVDKQTFNESGDTLTINANAFKDSTEKNIEDLLKKIPGISVDEKGKIKYQNKDIRRITIEGDDIAKYNYQIISRNFSARPIQDIQIISNFSENPLLAGVHGQNKETILNLKLDDKSKNVWSKQIDIYAAYPFLYDAYLNVGMISKKLKTINFVDANTMSRERISEFNIELPNQKNELFSDALSLKHTWIQLFQSNILNVEPFLYLNHEGYCVNSIALYKFNPKTTLKYTAYLNTNQQSFTEKQNLHNAGIFISGDRKLSQNKQIPFGDIELTYFPSKKHFFTYTSSYKQIRNRELENQAMNIFQNQADLNTNTILNMHKMTYTHPVKNKYLIQHQAKYTYYTQKINYDLELFPEQKFPTTNTYTGKIQQNFSIPQHNFTLQSDLFTPKVRYSVGYSHLSQDLQTDINTSPNFLNNAPDFINRSKYVLHQAGFSAFKESRWKKFTLTTEIKPYMAQWKHIRLDSLQQSNTVFAILPNIRLGYTFTKKQTKNILGVSYKYEISPSELRNLYTGYVFTSARNITRGVDVLYPSHNHVWSLSYSVNNFSKGISMINTLVYFTQKGLNAHYTQIDSIYTLSQVYPEQTMFSQIMLNSMLSKVFFKYRWAISCSAIGSQTENQNFLYGIPMMSMYRNAVFNIKAYLLPRKVFYFGIGSQVQYSYTQNMVRETPFRFSQYTYQISPYYDTHVRYKKWRFSTQGTYFLNYNNTFTTSFLLPWMSAECSYYATKTNWNIVFKCENLFNHTQWLTNSINTFTNQQSFIPMRGRVFVLNFIYTL